MVSPSELSSLLLRREALRSQSSIRRQTVAGLLRELALFLNHRGAYLLVAPFQYRSSLGRGAVWLHGDSRGSWVRRWDDARRGHIKSHARTKNCLFRLLRRQWWRSEVRPTTSVAHRQSLKRTPDAEASAMEATPVPVCTCQRGNGFHAASSSSPPITRRV